jgi:nitrogen regulatory protein PII
MKMLIIVYNDVVDEELVAMLKKAGVSGYTKWKEALGEGPGTGPKLATNIWPGKNNVIAVVVNDEELPAVSGFLRDLKGSHPKGGIKTFILQVEGTI